jgi:hypothetical protein
MAETYYNIHDVVRFKIIDKQKSLVDRIIGDPFQEYENYLSKNIIEDQNLDFVVNIVDKIEKREDTYILDDKYYISEGYIYTSDSYKIAKWDIEIIENSGKPIVKIAPNVPARLFISGFFTDFIIQYVLTQKGYSIVHSSAVSKYGRSYLFSGRGGSGKTSIAIRLISSGRNFEFMGDDFIIIMNGQAAPYFTPLNLFSYNITPFLAGKFRLSQKITFSIKKLLYLFTFGYAKFFTKLNPKQNFPGLLSADAGILKIFIILPTNRNNLPEAKITRISKSDAVEYLTNNLKMDSWYVPKYFIQYGFLFPNDAFSKFWEHYRNNLTSNLPNEIEYYSIELPISLSWMQLIDQMTRRALL